MFPENPPKYGAESYTVHTGEQHPLNSQLLREFAAITQKPWRKGPSKKERPIKPATTPTTIPAKRRRPPLQPVTAKKMKPTFLAPGRLTPPAASFDLSDSDDQDYETPDGEEHVSDDEVNEEEQEDIEKEELEE